MTKIASQSQLRSIFDVIYELMITFVRALDEPSLGLSGPTGRVGEPPLGLPSDWAGWMSLPSARPAETVWDVSASGLEQVSD